MYTSSLYPGAALIATGLAAHGYHKGSLSRSGAIAAFLVGYGHLANPLKLFGVSMIVFYLVGSRATKIKADVKATLEDGVDPNKPGGNRDAIQVLSNSLPSLLAALVYRYNGLGSNPVLSPLGAGVSRCLVFTALGHLSTCCADTLASELGILSTSSPRYILTGKPVPAGTNGGISLLGLGASALGGAVMGITMIADLLIEVPGLRNGAAYNVEIMEILGFGIAAGLAGSLLDSLLGATLQETLYSVDDKRILTDHSVRSRFSAGIKRIGIGRNILSNSGVNFICGWVMAGVGYWYASQ